jgi:murein DD-endopeptidase MepM/ murein hydrolase activator NlpD
MPKRLNDEITFMILPHSGHTPFSFKMSWGVLVFCLTILFFGALFVVGTFFFALSVNSKLSDYQIVKSQNARQVEEIRQLKIESESLKKDLKRLSDEERELRSNLGISEPSDSTSKAKSDKSSSIEGINPIGSEEMGNLFGVSMDPRLANIKNDLSIVRTQLSSRERSFLQISQIAKRKINEYASFPTGFPADGVITSYFGYRPAFGDFHPGIDVATSYGSPIYATGDGVVVFAGWYLSGYGMTVIIDHGNGYETIYAHDSAFAVRVGQRVKRGEVIAYIGLTGFTTGPHVHYEVHHYGRTINPMSVIGANPAEL